MRRYVEKPCLSCGNDRMIAVDKHTCCKCVRDKIKAGIRKANARSMKERRAWKVLGKRKSEAEVMTGVRYE